MNNTNVNYQESIRPPPYMKEETWSNPVLKTAACNLLTGGVAGFAEGACWQWTNNWRLSLQMGKENPKGFSGWFKGSMTTAKVMTVFLAFSYATKKQMQEKNKNPTAFDHVKMITASTLAGTAAMSPLDVSVVRMNRDKMTSIPEAFRAEVALHGYRGLFRCFDAGLMRNMPYCAALHFAPEVVKKHQHSLPQGISHSTATVATTALLAGATAFFTHPIDVVRTRMMRDNYNHFYGGWASKAKEIYHAEGAAAFTKGFLPRIIRVSGGSAGVAMSIVYMNGFFLKVTK